MTASMDDNVEVDLRELLFCASAAIDNMSRRDPLHFAKVIESADKLRDVALAGVRANGPQRFPIDRSTLNLLHHFETARAD